MSEQQITIVIFSVLCILNILFMLRIVYLYGYYKGKSFIESSGWQDEAEFWRSKFHIFEQFMRGVYEERESG